MAYSAREIRDLARQHQALQEQLAQARTTRVQQRMKVEKAVQAVMEQDVLAVLKTVPVEELNREKRGIRVKTLRDNGFATLADLAGVSRRRLSRIDGISPRGAEDILEMVKLLSDQLRPSARLRLSEDDKNPAASKLVTAVMCYHLADDGARESSCLDKRFRRQITQNLTLLQPAANGFKWFFTGRAEKQQVQTACTELENLLQGDYGRDARQVAGLLQKINTAGSAQGWGAFHQEAARFFGTIEDICPGVLDDDEVVCGLPEAIAQAVGMEPLHLEGLRCELRRYQKWGVKYILHQQRVLLGDEMGLGKTVQAIAAMVSLRNEGQTHFLVICPASVLENWCREIKRHSDLPVCRIHGSTRVEGLQHWKYKGGVAVTTYEATGSLLLENDFRMGLLTVDEAHYIKNPDAQRTARVKGLCLHSNRLLFMTGTALENRVSEMVALISILQPDIGSQISGMTFLPVAPQYREAIAPVYYRRKRDDVLRELPELTEAREWCELGSQERALYEQSVLEGHFSDARRVSWNVPDPTLSSKARRMKEIVEEAAGEGRKVIVYSFFLDTISKVAAMLGDCCTEPITGAVSPQHRQEIVDGFEKAPAGTVLPAQIQSGGTGLNIQAASVVILCEPQFKPSIENQAIARAYRMGQTRNVLVYRLLCEDTVDEQLTALLEQKQQTFDAFADRSAAAEYSAEVDQQSFQQIMEEERLRIQARLSGAGQTNT